MSLQLLSTVQKRPTKVWRERGSLEYNPRSGHPVTVTTEKNIDHVQHKLMDDKQLIISKNCEGVESILHNDLSMTRVSAQLVPRLFTPDQNCSRLVTSQEKSDIKADPADFLGRFLSKDEC